MFVPSTQNAMFKHIGHYVFVAKVSLEMHITLATKVCFERKTKLCLIIKFIYLYFCFQLDVAPITIVHQHNNASIAIVSSRANKFNAEEMLFVARKDIIGRIVIVWTDIEEIRWLHVNDRNVFRTMNARTIWLASINAVKIHAIVCHKPNVALIIMLHLANVCQATLATVTINAHWVSC